MNSHLGEMWIIGFCWGLVCLCALKSRLRGLKKEKREGGGIPEGGALGKNFRGLFFVPKTAQNTLELSENPVEMGGEWLGIYNSIAKDQVGGEGKRRVVSGQGEWSRWVVKVSGQGK